MAIMDAVAEWYEAHDAADFDRVAGIFTATGTYQDPLTGGPISGDAIRAHYTQRRGAFTDRVCNVVTSGAWSDTEAAARVSGSLRHIESGKVVTLETGEFFSYGKVLVRLRLLRSQPRPPSIGGRGMSASHGRRLRLLN
jgi:hypothetical protein